MALGTMLAKLLGKKLGGLLPEIEVRDGIAIMNPIKIPYKDKIAELPHEKVGVCSDYLKSLVEEAYKKHDMAGLKVIYDYLHGKVNDLSPQTTNAILKKIIYYGNELKIHHIMGDPFALVESIVRHIC